MFQLKDIEYRRQCYCCYKNQVNNIIRQISPRNLLRLIKYWPRWWSGFHVYQSLKFRWSFRLENMTNASQNNFTAKQRSSINTLSENQIRSRRDSFVNNDVIRSGFLVTCWRKGVLCAAYDNQPYLSAGRTILTWRKKKTFFLVQMHLTFYFMEK